MWQLQNGLANVTTKKGSQHKINAPTIVPSVLIALISRAFSALILARMLIDCISTGLDRASCGNLLLFERPVSMLKQQQQLQWSGIGLARANCWQLSLPWKTSSLEVDLSWRSAKGRLPASALARAACSCSEKWTCPAVWVLGRWASVADSKLDNLRPQVASLSECHLRWSGSLVIGLLRRERLTSQIYEFEI